MLSSDAYGYLSEIGPHLKRPYTSSYSHLCEFNFLYHSISERIDTDNNSSLPQQCCSNRNGVGLSLLWESPVPSFIVCGVYFCFWYELNRIPYICFFKNNVILHFNFPEISFICKWELGGFVSCWGFCLKQLFVDRQKWASTGTTVLKWSCSLSYQNSPSPEESTLCLRVISVPSSGRTTAWYKIPSRLLWTRPWSSITRLPR